MATIGRAMAAFGQAAAVAGIAIAVLASGDAQAGTVGLAILGAGLVLAVFGSMVRFVAELPERARGQARTAGPPASLTRAMLIVAVILAIAVLVAMRVNP
jgi:hypothetical protein